MTVLDDKKPVGELKPIPDVKVMPVGELKPLVEIPIQNNYYDAISTPDKLQNLNKIINDIPELPGDSESKKKLYKDLLLKGITPKESKEVLETLSGLHPHQDGGTKYYINDKGLPVPLKDNERPPHGYEVASIWGSKSDASDDNPLTDLAKTVFNVLPSSAENVVDFAQTITEGITDKPSDYLNSLKNAANYLKFEKDSDVQGSLLNTEGIDEFSDIADSKRWDFSPETLWGTALSLAGSVGEMYVGGKGLGTALKTAGLTTKAATAIATYTGSFLTNLGEARDEAEAAGLTGREKALFSSLVTGVTAAIDAKYDLGGKILSNKLMQEEKNTFIKKMALGVADRFADGEIKKEALDDLAKAMTVGYSQLAKKWSKETATDILQQGGEEAAQAFVMNAGEQLWDKLTDEEKKKFGKDAFNPQSFAEYLREGLAGAIGGGPTAFAFNKVKEQARIENQNKTAFGIATKGPDAVKAFKENVKNELEQGKLTPKEASDAVMQVDSYVQYNEELKAAGTELNDESKRQVFNLTFQKQNLMAQIPTEYEQKKLNGIQQAQINAKEKMAKYLQEDIDKIIFRENVKSEPHKVTDKAVEDIGKELQKEAEAKLKKQEEASMSGLKEDVNEYEEHPDAKKETRSYEDLTPMEWNAPNESYPAKLKMFATKLLNNGNHEVGEIVEGYKGKLKGRDIVTFSVKLPDGKIVKTASSVVRPKTKDALGGYTSHFRQEMLKDPDAIKGTKVAFKAHKLPSGRSVVSIYNPENGKHLAFVKERYAGNSKYNETDEKQLQVIQDTIEPPPGGEVTETSQGPTPNKGINIELGYTPKPSKVVMGKPTRENLRTRFIEDQKYRHKSEGTYNPEYDKIYENIYGKKFDKLNPELYVKKESAIGTEESNLRTNEESNSEDASISQEKKVRARVSRKLQKIKDPNRKAAIKLEVFSPEALVMQHFIGGGKISKEAVIKFYKGSEKEANLRSHMVALQSKYGKSYAPNFDELAHDLWENNSDKTPNATTDDYKNAVESVVQDYTSIVQMAKDLLATHTEQEQKAPTEEIISEAHIEAEKENTVDELNAIQDKLEEESDEELGKLADDQKAFDEWENSSDIDYYEGDIPFQKQSSVKGDVTKVIDKLKKSMPKMKVVYDENLKAAGKVKGDTITINTGYAGLDTPIHEYGHVLIDAIGYNNKVIQAAIKQLKGTDLWTETAKRYKELNEEMLGKEVLAEAIGLEGAGIFEKEADKSKFRTYLEYIFDWLKNKLGLNKNVAKSLAKQVISGIGTKEMVGSEQEQLQKTYKEELENLVEDIESRDLMDVPYEELVDVYNDIERAYIDENIGAKTYTKLLQTIMKRIALNLKERSIQKAEKELGKIVDRQASAHKDITKVDTFMKVLSHFGEAFPDMQYLSKLWDKAFLEKLKEAEELKNTNAQLAEKVIKEQNKQLGLGEKIKGSLRQILIDQKHNYFKFLDNGKGKIVTLEEAKGLSEAQIEYVKFVRELIGKKMDIEGDAVYDAEMDIIRLNKGFGEKLQTEGIISGLASAMTNDRLNAVRIKFKNPITGKEEVAEFKNVKETISQYSKKGVKEKTKAVKELFKASMAAKRQFKKGYHADGGKKNWPMYKSGRPTLDENGKLPSKFGRINEEDVNYSTDFFDGVNQYIDDYTHIKHISPLVPIINSVEYLAKTGVVNENGVTEHQKKNLAEWFDKWQKLHILRSLDEFEPNVDAALRTLRTVTSLRTMLFNVPAQLLNAAMGIYNNWVDMNGKDFAKGLKRMFIERKGGKGWATNKYMMDIAKKYKAVSVDMDSSPLRSGTSLFSTLGHLGTKFGETMIQVSGLAGRMSDKDYNSFEYKKNKYGVDELVVKDSLSDKEKEELETRILKHINAVSDIQGKYSDKDKRNIMNNELGKTVLQFKVWMPDWWRTRFGDQGRWTKMVEGGFAELRNDIREKGTVKAFWENKNFMSNLKGAMMVAFLLTLVYGDDDDEEKSFAAKTTERFLSDVLFIFDPDNAKFTISRPVAAAGTIEKFIDALDHLMAFEANDYYKGNSKWGDKGEAKLRGDVMNFVPGKKVIEYLADEE